MTNDRAHPFTLVFGELAESRFPLIRAAVGQAPELDAFLMAEPAISLLQDLRPDEGLGDGRDDFVAFVHAAYRFWADGCQTRSFDLSRSRALCRSGVWHANEPTTAQYIQIAPRLIWGSLDGGEHHEPLDGWFSVPTRPGLRVIAGFGIHEGRPGLSVLVVEGRLEAAAVHREDGSPLFAPTMSGGEAAELHSVASLEELLLLAWRATAVGGDR